MVKRPKLRLQEADLIRGLLRSASLPRDSLPYTEEFLAIKQRYEQAIGRPVGDGEFWQLLLRVGKLGLGRLRKKGTAAPKLSVEEQLEILRLLPEGTGTRDRLPYTAEFDDLHHQFGRWTGRKLSAHEFWRALSSLAKKSRKPKPIHIGVPLLGLPPETVENLEFTNPWWRGMPGPEPQRFRRWAFQEAWQRLHSGVTPAVAIRGPRQVGKTTIQRQIIEQLLLMERVGPERILRVQFDDVPQMGALRQPIVSLVRWFEKKVLGQPINGMARKGQPVYLLFDEVQNLKSWAAEVKFLVDHATARVLITGSSSLRMTRGQDNLAGRVSWIDLGPLRLREIAGIRRLAPLPPVPEAAALDNWVNRGFWLDLASLMERHASAVADVFDHFSALGGYPVCHRASEQNRSELAEIVVDTVVARTIERDVRLLAKGRRWDAMFLRHAFRQVCRYAGQSVRPEGIAREINDTYQSRVTANDVTRAIRYFADAMLIHLVDPLEVALKRQSHAPKLCLCDHFVREAWLQETVPLSPRALAGLHESVASVAGHIVESVIGYFLKGIPGAEVAWFPKRKHEPEVDFVVTVGSQRVPIEVKYGRAKPRQSDCDGIESFCRQKKYGAPFGLLLTQDTTGRLGEFTIALPVGAFLAVL